MGCDIHGFLEVRKVGVWKPIMDISYVVHRNYRAFAFLFDVRNTFNVRPLAPHRGVPADLSDAARSAYNALGDDAHSASWLTQEDLAGVDMDMFSSYTDLRWKWLLAILEDVSRFDTARLVVWFDN